VAAGTSPNNVVPGYYYNSNTPALPIWKRFATGNGDAWIVGGNNFGTTGANYKLGTISNDHVDFITNNIVRGRLSNLGEFLSLLTLENWQQWLSQLQQKEVTIMLPKFKSEYEQEMKDILVALGMRRAFSSQEADFTALTSAQVNVSNVKHKTFVEVNEEGTEAAAVTSIGVRATSIRITPTMEVNRPFFYVIGERQTDTILFMGAMLNPTEK
jgi:serine protease inhibitor